MRKFLTVMAALMLAATGQSFAATFSYDLSTEFSGGTDPVGPTPWVTVSFADFAADTVRLTIDATGLSANEFFTEFDFNYLGGPALTSASFTNQTATTGTVANPSIATGSNAFKADGDGFFDITFGFQTSAGSGRFGADDVWRVDIGGTGLSASMFNQQSFTGGDNGIWYVAAHVQGIGSAGGSGWIGGTPANPIPEPEIYAMMAAGLGLMGFVARRRKQLAAA